MADYIIYYRLIPQVLPNKWVRDYFWQCMGKIHWARLSYGQRWCTLEKQWTYRIVCACQSVCGASLNRWLRCRIRHLASAFWMTGGEVTVGHIWRVGGETDFLLGLCLSLSLSAFVVSEWEAGCPDSRFCTNFIILISFSSCYSSGPRENMQMPRWPGTCKSESK